VPTVAGNLAVPQGDQLAYLLVDHAERFIARGVRRQPQMLSEAPIRRSFGGAAIAFIGVILETIISALIAPAMMLIQSQAIAAIMMGRDVGWQVQRRNDGSLSWPESARRYAGHTVFGFILGASAYAVSLPLFLWMTPVVVGLLLTIPLAVLTSYSRLGDGFKRVGLFVTPEEHELPEIVRRSNEVASELARDQPAALHLLLRDRDLAEIHRQMIAQKPAKKRGEVDVDLVVGRAKLEQTHNLEEANSFLTIKEKAAILADPVSFEQLIERLKDPVVARGTPTR
jgi:membrane glycosyltransferase